jgi:trans-aconitate 2-methyltransferase
MSWNPSQYLQYEDARLRPALDLLARIPLERPATIVDLGCGAGNVAQWLARRWPDAQIVGVDGDAAMLDKARQSTSGSSNFSWVQSDLGAWRADAAPDLIYSNAALHWLDGHEALFPRLMQGVAPGGALAVQMPDNFRAPSHRLLNEVAWLPRWRDAVGTFVRRNPVHAPEQYFDWLEPHARAIDAWSTEYLQLLPARTDGEHPVVAWMKGSALVPMTAALDAPSRGAFVDDYAERIERAYVRRSDGTVLFPFRRVFIVATR